MIKIAIIGSGIVGEAAGKGFIKAGHAVTFVDVEHTTLERLRLEGLDATEIDLLNSDEYNMSILCLPAPLRDEKLDLKAFKQVLPSIANIISKYHGYHVVVVKSTVLPGTTEGFIIPELERCSNRTAGQDFGVCVNPEFLRQKTAQADFLKPKNIVVGALDPKSREAVVDLYRYFIEKEKPAVTITDPRTAETIKYAQNIYNALKISFTNEIWKLSQAIGIDGDEVMSAVALSAEGMWNPTYGTRGGYPYGGHCLPKDTRSLLVYAKNELKIDMPLLEAAIKVNDSVTVRPTRKEANL